MTCKCHLDYLYLQSKSLNMKDRFPIEVDFVVYQYLFSKLQNSNDNINNVLRKTLGFTEIENNEIRDKEPEIFSKINGNGASLRQDYRTINDRKKNVLAKGIETERGRFLVLAGASLSRHETPSTPVYIKELREDLKRQGIISGNYELVTDYEFNSGSQAAGVILGGSYSGNREWKK